MKQTKRLFISCLLLLGFTIGVWAQNTVVIYQKDGQVATFAFTEKPVVTYSGNNLVITTENTSVQYPVSMLHKLEFDIRLSIPTGIDDAKEKRVGQFSFSGGQLLISGGEAGSEVSIYTLRGAKAAQYRLDSNGSASIPLQGLGKAVYVVRTKGFTFKFHKP